ncbi:M23 family metallopeptidase [Mariniflexile sp. AS56]|uniref:M23 family metallopeptidase n=1 Tax=Mariniflexile sp. AS56 TaxID=3063957 RepID=UPI0026EECEF1|nr:M23 family metallopeptidase [Mariniflexile sp. AS56]MDO7173652.1 M23 family metallopeptidase [Mariniflexile sp. AS56]
MRFILYFLLVSSTLINAQNNYPQDYFASPLEIPLILSGTFAELRSNHFHSGLDIKTQQREGLKVISCADGFVSRIKLSHFGYGKALYITHPNGYTTVYGHLQNFSPEIDAYIKKQQYEAESYEIELFPSVETLPVTKGSLVAYSGNTGGSGGPHLHFEIRDKEERPINPMLFGIDIKDNSRPIVSAVYAYALDENGSVNKSSSKQKLRLIPLKNGEYTTESIEAFGAIGFGVETTDRQDLAANSNGVYNIQTFVNGNQNFEVDFSIFSFDESSCINQFIDYEHYINSRQRIQRLYKKNNPLSILKPTVNDGILEVKDSTATVYKIRVSDFKNNETFVTINIKGKKSNVSNPKVEKTTPYYITANQATNLKSGNVSVDFYPNTFYEDFYMNFDVSNDTLTLHQDVMPTRKNFTINYDISNYKDADKDQLFIARLVGSRKYPSYSTTKREGNILTTSTKTLGSYGLASDTTRPSISPINFKEGQWLSDYRFLKVRISDNLSGISNYRATINGKWILMEYEYKNNTLTYDFNDSTVTDTKNDFKLIVTDNVGNSATFEATFFRK